MLHSLGVWAQSPASPLLRGDREPPLAAGLWYTRFIYLLSAVDKSVKETSSAQCPSTLGGSVARTGACLRVSVKEEG